MKHLSIIFGLSLIIFGFILMSWVIITFGVILIITGLYHIGKEDHECISKEEIDERKDMVDKTLGFADKFLK